MSGTGSEGGPVPERGRMRTFEAVMERLRTSFRGRRRGEDVEEDAVEGESMLVLMLALRGRVEKEREFGVMCRGRA